MIKKLKDYTEPATFKKTSKMLLIEMCASPIAILNGISSKLGCKNTYLQKKWERNEILERAMRKIDNDLDVVELVKV